MFKDAFKYWKEYGFLALLKRIPVKLCELLGLCERKGTVNSPAETENAINGGNKYLKPIRIFTSPGRKPCINLVAGPEGSTESNMDVAILFANMLADNRDYGLRIISSPETNKNHFHDLLKSSGIPFQKNVDFLSLYPQINSREIDITHDDVFLTTSWQTTHMVIESIDEGKVVYLIQGDERKLLVADDDSDMSVATLRNRNINFVIKSRQLYEDFISEGFDNICERGAWFDADSLHGHRSGDGWTLHGVEDALRKLAGLQDRAGSDVSV